MKWMQSTFLRVRSTRWTVVLDTGFLTKQYPALRRSIIHSEWNAGMSVRRLAQMIIGYDNGGCDQNHIGKTEESNMRQILSSDMSGPCIHSFVTLIGNISLTEDGEGNITALYLPCQNLPSMDDRETDILLEASAQLNEYLSGRRKEFDLPLLYPGTDFSISVLEALRKIPYGEVRTYSDIAGMIGNPRAYRAVGTACSNNPLPIIIPCHRIVPSSGGIGNYSGGTAIKRRLLDFEAEHRD